MARCRPVSVSAEGVSPRRWRPVVSGPCPALRTLLVPPCLPAPKPTHMTVIRMALRAQTVTARCVRHALKSDPQRLRQPRYCELAVDSAGATGTAASVDPAVLLTLDDGADAARSLVVDRAPGQCRCQPPPKVCGPTNRCPTGGALSQGDVRRQCGSLERCSEQAALRHRAGNVTTAADSLDVVERLVRVGGDAAMTTSGRPRAMLQETRPGPELRRLAPLATMPCPGHLNCGRGGLSCRLPTMDASLWGAAGRTCRGALYEGAWGTPR